ncbi:MAG: RHS repeat-associated core domain-containing protein [archaeon]
MKGPIKILKTLSLCNCFIVLVSIIFLLSIISLNSLDVYASESYTAYVPFNSKTLMSDDGNINYYHHDYLGNVVVKTDNEADIVWEADYEPFGDTFNEQGSNEFRFTGKELDGSGLHYFGARYYDKETGRFISADSIEGNIEKPQTLNRYSYVLNNPLKYNDPTGNVPGNANSDFVNPSVQNLVVEGSMPDAPQSIKNTFEGALVYGSIFDSIHVNVGAGVRASALEFTPVNFLWSSESENPYLTTDFNPGLNVNGVKGKVTDDSYGFGVSGPPGSLSVRSYNNGARSVTVGIPGLNAATPDNTFSVGVSPSVTFYTSEKGLEKNLGRLRNTDINLPFFDFSGEDPWMGGGE